MSQRKITNRLNNTLKSKHMEVVPKKPGVKISSIEDNLRKEKESLMTVVETELKMIQLTSHDFEDAKESCETDRGTDEALDETSEEEKAKKGNNQNVKKNKRNNPNFSEAEDLVLYSFVFRLIQKGIPKSQLKLNTARTWNKVHKYATINRDGDSMRQRWNKYLKKLDRIVQIDDFPPEMEQVLRETFGN